MSKYVNEKKRMLQAEKIIGQALKKNIKTIENNFRSSAVICLIFYENNKLNILLTKRSEKLVNHAGEISFPGGKVESFDQSPLEAALRETNEEIGVPEKDIKVLGKLDEIVTGTGFHITPYVGILITTKNIEINVNEVSEIIKLPIQIILNKNNHIRLNRQFNKIRYNFWKIKYLNYNIWGATASILVGFAVKITNIKEYQNNMGF
tara:strand:+ start:16 stop:633 length:618 start_codon:yes stop_codon:yes gene_type:complete